MGHIAHMRKQFISINTYDYIITLIKRRKKPLLSKWELVLHLKKHEFLSSKDALCQDWLKFAQWFLRRGFFNLSMYVYLPSEKGGALHLNKLESPSPMDALCQGWLKLALWFWKGRFFNFVNVFSQFRNYVPLEKGGALNLNNLNPLHPGMLCAKFGWIWIKRSNSKVKVTGSKIMLPTERPYHRKYSCEISKL